MALSGSRIVGYAAGLVASLVLFPTVASAPRKIAPHTPATFVVNSTGDASDATPGDGICDIGGSVCTLRAAMEEANANAGADTINFAIGTGPQTIAPATGLPAINETVTIDGTTQPGYSGTPLIELDGTNAGDFHGIHINNGPGSTIKALMINSFQEVGIAINDVAATIELCYVGTDATRTQDRGNGADGISLNNDGAMVRDNVVAFNANNGVAVYDGEITAYPDFTALTPDQTAIFPSIDFSDDCGSFRHSAGSVIVDTSGRTFNEHFGMRLTATMSISQSGTYNFDISNVDDNARLLIDAVEYLNLTGSPGDADVALSMGDHSIEVDYHEGGGAANLVLGVSGPSTPTFNFSATPGFQGELFQMGVNSVDNTISENSIFDNGWQGIALGCCCFDNNDAGDIDIGPNNFLNFPDITNHFTNLNGSITVQGTAPVGSFVEVFGSTNDGRGEGKLYLTTSAIVPGDGSFIATFDLPQPYYSVTTTATDASGNTSEFSHNTPVRARQITVTTSADSGPGSLRAAIDEANGDGVDTLITFEPALIGVVIALGSPLPALTENETTINGDLNSDCHPDIEINGGGVSTAITINSQENTIRGLAIYSVSTQAILMDGGGAQNNSIVCNYLGTTRTGLVAPGGGSFGVVGQNGAANNVIGRIGEGNLITGLDAEGVRLDGGTFSVVRSNTIGFDANGNVLDPPTRGIQLINSNQNIIGEPGAGNRIVATTIGIDVAGGNANNIRGNTIGWPDGTATPTGVGIRMHSGANGSTIGDFSPGGGNHIENNGGSGVRLDGADADNISIRGNSISNNGSLGIDLDGEGVTPNDGNADADVGANENLNFPVLTRATTDGFSTIVEGLIDTSVGGLQIDFYASDERDPTGYGEGATFLQSFGVASGSFLFNLPPLPVGTWITATTNAGGNTSEFSLAIAVSTRPLGPTELTAWPADPAGISLRWRDPQTSETAFRIEGSNDGVNFYQVTNVGPDVTTYTDLSVGPQQTVTYRVIATSPSGDSPPSNLATATTYSNAPVNVCRTNLSGQQQFAERASVVHNGTDWAVAWSDKKNGAEADIYFQHLANADGAPIGSPIQVSSTDASSQSPSLAWSGTQYGLLWRDHLRQASGEARSSYSFALLNNSGTKVRGDLRIGSSNPAGSNPDGQFPLIWDGGGWGIFTLEKVGGGSQQVVFYRLAANGDVLVNGVTALNTPAEKQSVSAAWNGTEYAFAYSLFPTGLRFVRMQPNGTAIGTFVNVGQFPNATTTGTSIVWDGTNWAMTWSDTFFTGDRVVSLRLIDASGNPLGAGPVRISDDGAVIDEHPRILNKPGGGFFIYTTSMVSGVPEVGRLEADASGNRVGSRIIVSPSVGFASSFPRAATNGTTSLVAWQESGVNPSEIGVTVVDSAGVTGPLYNLTPGRIPPSHSTFPVVAPLTQNGFVTVWNERFADGNNLQARLVRGNGTFVDRKPLSSPADPATRPAVVSRGPNFAVAWTDADTNALRFQNFDFDGISFGPAYDVANPVDVDRGVGMAGDGQIWGAAWIASGQLRFQRVGSNAPIGVPTNIGGMPNPSDPKVQWVGSGWALLWRASGNLWYALVDPAGALLVPPARVTDSFGSPTEPNLLWTGEHLGVAYAEGTGVFFTTIDLNGIKNFNPVAVASPGNAVGYATLYFDGDDFHVVHPHVSTGIRDVAISPGGVIGTSSFLGNHAEGRIDAAWNGATVAMAWEHQAALLMQTSACLSDVTRPNCVTLNGSFNTGAVQLNWPAANDPQSGILAYHLYRDGALLAELLPTTLMYSDGGFTPGFAHVYELRPFNGAYLEATGCTTKTVTAGILVNPATLPNARQNQNYNQTITASQGTPTYSFAVTSGALPANLILNPGSGAISGQPQNIGTFNFTITATDSLAATGSRAYTLRVCPQTLLAPTVLPDPIVNTSYQQTISVTGTSDPTTFAVTSGALPAGLTLAANGTLAGTPTATGTFNFTVTATESTGCSTSQPYTFDVRTGLAPRDVQADAQSTSSILVRWTRPQHGETGFRIERSQDGITWGSINNVGSDVTSHLDSGLSPSTLYYYRVVAFSGAVDAGTSNVAAAMTLTGIAFKVCQRPIGIIHTRAQFSSVAHDGTKWGAVWQDRNSGQLENIYFQFLDNLTGAPTGSPVQITQTEMLTRFPTVRWNGSHYGVLYTENLRSPAGDVTATTNFALVDSSGTVVRKGVRVSNGTQGSLNSNLILPLQWDGAGWGVFATEARGNPPAEIYYWRLSPNGDVVTGPVRLTNTPDWETELAVAWNGTEYGLAWIQFKDTTYKLFFQRMQPNGTLIGAPVLLEQNPPGNTLAMTALTWNGSEWAVAFARTSDEWGIHLRRLNPDGTPIAAATRISDDANPSEPIDDNFPVITSKAGGGYHFFTVSFNYASNTAEVARLEADASGNRVGSRAFLTPDNDDLNADHVRMATDGTRFLIAHGANGPAQQEVATLITDAAGAVTNGPTPITSGHVGGTTQSTVIQRLGAGWVVVTNGTHLGGQLIGKVYDSNGTQTAAKVPLSPTTGVRSRIGMVTVGQTFAVAWRDQNSLRFCRYNSAGDPLFAEVVLPSGGNQSGLAWNGEHYGLIFFEGGNLRFQRLDANGVLLGPKVSVGTGASNVPPQMLWVGKGWGIVWRRNTDLYYALLDRNGAFIVPPLQVTFTGTNENNPQIAWSGDRLGLVWNESLGLDPPGSDIFFTVLGLDGTKDFAVKNVVSTTYGDNAASIYWSGDRFRIVHNNALGGVREIALLADGTLLPGNRIYHNRNINMSIAWNGITLGMAFNGLYDLTLQNSACFDDTTAPPCPNTAISPSFDGVKVRVTWPAVSDPESGILAYNVYRDGTHLAEVPGTTTLFDDFGFVSGATHAYEVRAVNGAYLESPGCTIRNVVAGINLSPATLPNANVGGNYSQTFAGLQGTAPYTFAVTAGALPPGLSLNGMSGALTGNPTAGGIFNFTITATDALAQTGSRVYSLRVCSGLTLFPTVLIDGYLDREYSQTIVTAGANGAVTLSVTTGALPAGLTMDAAGWIHGIPTTAGTTAFTITATDSTGCIATHNYSIVIQSGQAARRLSAFALGTSSIRLRWTDPQRNETSFRIERSPDLGGTWAPIAIVGPDTVTSTDSALAGGTTYSYRVIATTPSGDASPSNVATASTFPATAAKSCLQMVSPYHSTARNPTVAWNGTQWAMVWGERTGGREDDLMFTFLDANGAMTGSPKQLTSTEMGSFRPALRWNGSKFGVMWTELHRGPVGEAVNEYRFALLDATGTVIRTDVMIQRPAPVEFSSQSTEPQFLWDGSAWTFFETHFTSDGLMDIFFYRFDEDGDMLAGPTRLTTHPNFDVALSVAWNGTEYAMAWGRFIDNVSSIEFQRVSSSGALVGSQVTVAAPSTNGTSNPDVAPTPIGWAVIWRQPDTTNGFAVMLQRLSAAGALTGSPTRVNDDFDLNGFTPANQRPSLDSFPDLFTLPDGSFVVFTTAQLNVTGRQEVAMLRADAAGVRVGSRIVLSAQDNFNSNVARAATNGTNFLLAFNEARLGTAELASLITTPTGTLVAGPTDLTSGHSAGFVVNTSVAPLGSGFAALFTEPLNATTNQVYARIFDGTGALSASKSPLSTLPTRGRAAIVGVGSTFATVWKTPANAVVFGRWDASGNALVTEVNVATGAGGPQHVNVGFDGENYGVLWNQNGRLTFQRVSPAGALLGARSTLVNLLDGQPQQMVWTALGWAIVFISNNDVYYTLLDTTGATIVAPMRISFTPTFDKIGLALAWNGDVLGLTWTNYPIVDPPGLVVQFTVLNLDGIKQFNETVVAAEGRFDNNIQGMYWDADRFKVIFIPGEGGALRSVDVGLTGAVLGPSRMLSNRGFGASVAFNGTTAGMIWLLTADQYFQTTACLDDVTPPSCPSFSAVRNPNGITLTWTAATDAQSGIYRYVIYRDGMILGDAPSTVTTYTDASARVNDTFTYSVVAQNSAYLLSTGCSTQTVIGNPTALVASATSATQVHLTWAAVGGATSYSIERSSSGLTFTPIGTSVTASYDDSVAAGTSHIYRVRAIVGAFTSDASNHDLATTVLFTDDPLVVGVTRPKSVHVTQLRTAVNAVRALAGLSPATFTGSAAAGTAMTATHVNELRAALTAARTTLGLSTVPFTNTVAPGVIIRAIDVQEVRTGVK